MTSPPPKHSLSSPTASNPHQPVLPTPSSSTSVSLRQINYRSNQLRKELELQLFEKKRQLQESSSGIGKNVLARQIAQLQERIKEIDNVTQHIDLQSTNSIERLRSLERDLTSYRSHPLSPGISSIRNKEKLFNQRSTSSSSAGNGLSPLPSPSASTLLPSAHGHDSTSLLPLPPPPTGSTPTKRRSKIPTTDRRNTDIEFATEIGQGLLLEVRKMQALLQEKEEKLRTLENQKADLERTAEAMAKQMRQREENEEKLKEETWNLELAKQELVISVTELQSNLNKANSEQNKLAKQVNELRSEIEHLRDKEEKLTSTIENMKQRHEQDMSSIRRQAAAFQREKQEQTKKIEALTSELAITKAQSRIGKHSMTDSESSNRRAGILDEQTDSDQLQSTFAVKNENSPHSSPPTSPKISPSRNQAMEVETLKTSLAHAHRMVSNLRSNLHKEKTEKFEFKKLLAESQETIEQLRNDPRLWVDAGPARNSNGSPVTSKTEDNLFTGRRSRKASRSSSKRRGKKSRHKFSKNKNTSENDSVYSYSSMSDNDSSLDESDADPATKAAALAEFRKLSQNKTPEFTVLSSELSQSKPVMIDVQVNTEPINSSEVQRCLGDELKVADSSVLTGGMVAASAAILNTVSKPKGIEITTQTEPEPEKAVITGIEILTQTEIVVATEICTQTENVAVTDGFMQTNPLPVMTESSMQTETDPKPEVHEVSMQTEDVNASDMFVQTEKVCNTFELSTQTDSPATAEVHIQTDDQPVPEAFEISTQTEPKPLSSEVSIQTEQASFAEILVQTEVGSITEISVQTEPESKPTVTETFTQTETVTPSEIFVQTEAAIPSETFVQTETAVPTENFVQTEKIIPTEIFVQTEKLVQSEIAIQTESVEPNEILVQTDEPAVTEISTQTSICVLEHVVLDSVSSEPATVTLADYSQVSIDVQPEDPSIAAANLAVATAAAIHTARLASIEAAVDNETQYDAIPAIDQETQFDIISGTDCGVQHDIVPVDAFIQMDSVAATDASIQYDAVTATDSTTQYEAVETKDTQVQSEPAETKDTFAQSEAVELKDMQVQSEPPETRDTLVQSDPAETKDSFVQSIALETQDTAAQSNIVETKDTVVQSEPAETRDMSIQYEPTETKDMPVQSEPAETTDSYTQSSVEAKDSIIQSESVETIDTLVQSEPAETKDSFAQSECVQTVDSIVQYDAIETRDACIQYEVGFNDTSVALGRPLATRSLETSALNYNASLTDSSNIMIDSIDSKDQTRDIDIPTTFVSQKDKQATEFMDLSNNKELSDAGTLGHEEAKVYSKAETDALIAAAVASALADTTTTKDAIDSEATTTLLDEPKRHTCDMSSNTANTMDSVATTPYTGSLYMIDDDDYPYSEQDFGDVMVHVPTDRDIITYSPYREEREKQRQAPPRELELSIGPTIVHEFKPTEDEISPVRTIVGNNEEKFKPVIEIPARPTSRPPTELLTRAMTSSPLTDTPISMEKTVSLGGSSASSINEIESDLTCTDPTIVSMITQTMIGDWMWKYTRNAVGHGISENRHQRYFWIHPYTRTLYWSTNAPGVDGSEAKAKSALIESVTSVPDYSATNYGLPNVSLLIQTSQRQLKLTAPNMEKHEAWFESLSYLVTHNNEEGTTSGLTLLNDTPKKADPLLNNSRSVSSMTSGTLLKGPSPRRTNDIFHQSSIISMSEDPLDLEDDDNEPLEDVRMCCNGKHHVSRLEKDHIHRHHYRKRKSRATIASVA